MSYCRADKDSDVYSYHSIVTGHFVTHANGESYSDETPQSFLDRLLKLRAEGLKVPQNAIDRIADEIAAGHTE